MNKLFLLVVLVILFSMAMSSVVLACEPTSTPEPTDEPLPPGDDGTAPGFPQTSPTDTPTEAPPVVTDTPTDTPTEQPTEELTPQPPEETATPEAPVETPTNTPTEEVTPELTDTPMPNTGEDTSHKDKNTDTHGSIIVNGSVEVVAEEILPEFLPETGDEKSIVSSPTMGLVIWAMLIGALLVSLGILQKIRIVTQ
jgi:outer membrane biosynthesis protein TonB